MQDQAESQRAIEPIGGLFDGPAGAVGVRAGRFDRNAFPAVGKRRMPLVEMSRDAVARGLRPVAQPAGRFHRAGRQTRGAPASPPARTTGA